jgi:pimeloyl-ACP methyl ester carboxylesterase
MQNVRTERNGGVVTVILSRPSCRNAVDRQTADELVQAFLGFETDESAHVAVPWGEGGAFCTGADLKALADGRGNRFDEPAHALDPMAADGPMGPTRMRLSKPVIAAAGSSSEDRMSTFVLVHGAWHGGWCWHKIGARLEMMGHSVFAPDMPGHGIDRAPIADVTMSDIVRKMSDVIDLADEPVILVGHSYGGAVISRTAEVRAGRIAKLVYVSAFLLSTGESTMASAQADPQSDLADRIRFSPDGKTMLPDPAIVRQAFYAQCSQEDVALARILLTPEAVAGAMAPTGTGSGGSAPVPSIYIECLKDRAITPAHQRRMQEANPCGARFALDTDHSPFFSAPDQPTQILGTI